MRGKASGSDGAAKVAKTAKAAKAANVAEAAKAANVDWAELSLEESGGFAGLRRGATLQRQQLSPARAKRVGAALEALAGRPAVKAPAYPDGQTLRLHVRSVGGSWSASFDTADLPKAAADLLDLAPLGPLPPP